MLGLGVSSAKMSSRKCASIRGAENTFLFVVLEGMDWLSPDEWLLAWKTIVGGRVNCWEAGGGCSDWFEALGLTSLDLDFEKPKDSKNLSRFLVRAVLLALLQPIVRG